jgi:hypothetical protein
MKAFKAYRCAPKNAARLEKKMQCAAAVVHASHAMLKMATRSDKGDFVGRDNGPRSLLYRSRQGHKTSSLVHRSGCTCRRQIQAHARSHSQTLETPPSASTSFSAFAYLLLLPTRHTTHLSGTFSIECILSLTFSSHSPAPPQTLKPQTLKPQTLKTQRTNGEARLIVRSCTGAFLRRLARPDKL